MVVGNRRLLSRASLVALACSSVLVSAQVEVSRPDDLGATPLMQAAAFGALAELRSLLDAGADVNAAATNGATALMWAAGDVDKVRLLLGHGAEAGTVAADGTTALVAAVNRGDVASVEALLARGVPAKDARDQLLQAAFATSNPSIRQLLRKAHISATSFSQVRPALLRVEKIDTPLVRELLDLGLDPNLKAPFATVEFPLIGYAAFTGEMSLVQLLVDRGADTNLATSRQMTPLMLAAVSDHPNPGIVTLLLERGARPDARDEAGRSALDWALLQGDTGIARMLRHAGAPTGTAPTTAPTAPPTTTPPAEATPRLDIDAIAAALRPMNGIGPAFSERTKCVSCHNQSLPAMARQLAAGRGVDVAPDVRAHPTQASLQLWAKQRGAFMVGRCGSGGFVQSVGYGLTTMALEGAPPTTATDAAVTCLASRQYPDGSWTAVDVRPPLGGSPIVFTALAIRSLDRYMPAGLRPQAERRIARGREFLRHVTPQDTQDVAMKLLGLSWSQATAADIAELSAQLKASQRSDGGWGQVPTMASDAYATGQAMFALAAGGMLTDDAVYRKGVAYLLRSQLPDGTWFVRSRGVPFQAYFDTGFPHDRNQFISAAATSWAVMALAR
jgi:ankyrin repeat protein